jgi:hypothetical protein
MTNKEVKAERDALRKKLDSGKIKGKAALKKARGRMYYLNGVLKHGQARKQKAAVKKAQRSTAKKFNPDQGFLPTFLAGLNTVRIEELIAEKAFKQIQASIEKNLGLEPTESAKLKKKA